MFCIYKHNTNTNTKPNQKCGVFGDRVSQKTVLFLYDVIKQKSSVPAVVHTCANFTSIFKRRVHTLLDPRNTPPFFPLPLARWVRHHGLGVGSWLTVLSLGISRDSEHKRRATSGRFIAIRKKRKFALGRPPAMTKLGTKKINIVRCRGGNLKHRALRLEHGSFSWGSEAISKKVRIVGVSYNASNNELVRTNTLVKNAIVQVDAAPFRQYYLTHYGLDISKIDEHHKSAAAATPAAASAKVSKSEKAAKHAAKVVAKEAAAAAAAEAKATETPAAADAPKAKVKKHSNCIVLKSLFFVINFKYIY